MHFPPPSPAVRLGTLARALATVVLATSLTTAQQAVLLPANANTTMGSGISDPNSWGNGLGATGPGVRAMACFRGSNFTARGVGTTVTIDRLRFRAAAPGNAVTVQNARVDLSTSASPAMQLAQAFDSNHGTDRVVVFQGAVQVQTVGSASPVGPFHVDIVFTQPFVFDPFAGDLLLDLRVPSAGLAGAGATPNEIQSAQNQWGSGMYGSLTSPFAMNTLPVLPVVELGYTVPAGSAAVNEYGTGCPERRAACFEEFESSSHPCDLAGTSVRYTPIAGGYRVDAGTAALSTLPSTVLPLGDEECTAALPLPFVFPFVRNGASQSTPEIVVSSNGFVWLDGGATDPGPGASAVGLCLQAARIAAHWTDLNPSAGGSVRFAADAASGTAVVTWDAVPEAISSGTITAQVVLHANGDFELRYGPLAASLPSFAGFAPGNTLLAGSVDLSAAAGLLALADAQALRLVATDRPVLGTSFAPEIRRVPNGASIGLVIYSTTQLALDLTFLGIDGCWLWTGLDVIDVVVPLQEGATSPIVIPVNQALVGFQLTAQAAAAVSGFNPFGLVTSNGLLAVIGTQ